MPFIHVLCIVQQSGVMEHCVHCLALFPLDELIQHSALCKQRGGEGGAREGSQGDPLERCMHCFKDFPLSQMVVHSNMCMGKGASRFKNFIPSVHDVSHYNRHIICIITKPVL